MVRRRLPLLALVAGLLLLAGAAAESVHPLFGHANRTQPTPATAPVIAGVAPAPAPTEAAAPASVREGLRVRIPVLGIDLPVVEGDGINAPLYQAAHYPGMRWPGEGGRSLLYAHARIGMFGPLFGARLGEEIQIERPGEQPLLYTIRRYVSDWPATDVSILQPGDHEQLVLLTCTTYDPRDPRIVVIAEPSAG